MELSKGKIGSQLLCSILSKLYGTPYSIGMQGHVVPSQIFRIET